jgi:hypothetical protein
MLLPVVAGLSLKAYNAYLLDIPKIKRLLDEYPEAHSRMQNVDRTRRILEVIAQATTEPPKGKRISKLTWVVDPEVKKLQYVVRSTMSAAVVGVLNKHAAPILANIDGQGLEASTIAGAVRTNSARYGSYPGVSFLTTRSPDETWKPVPDELAHSKLWGIRANIEWPDGLKLSRLSPVLGHQVDSRLDFAGSTLIQSSPQLVVSALAPTSDPETSPGPIHKQPAEAWTWLGQVRGRCTVRFFGPESELRIRSDHTVSCGDKEKR